MAGAARGRPGADGGRPGAPLAHDPRLGGRARTRARRPGLRALRPRAGPRASRPGPPRAARSPGGRIRMDRSCRPSPSRSRPPSRSECKEVGRSYKTEAIVLRSILYGEADRVLHLYSPDRGRLGAVAKGVRRVKSRLGGRLEPPSRVRLVLDEGRGELCTISQVDTVHPHAALRERRDSLERATQACEAVLRLLDSTESNRPAYNLLCNELGLLDADAAAAS